MKYLLPKTNYYKANLHTHTTISDGVMTPEEMKAFYKDHGYQILALTDHNLTIPHNDLTDPDFLMITGTEVDLAVANARKTCHLCLLSRDPESNWIPFRDPGILEHMKAYEPLCQSEDLPQAYSPENINRVIAKANEKGFLVTYNHPCWSLEFYEDYSHYEGLWAMEYRNSGCIPSGYDEDNGWVYREFLNQGKRPMPIMADDAHGIVGKRNGYPVAGRSWTMVGAEKLEYGAVMDALAAGEVYSSCGPEIYSLTYEDGVLRVTCSPAAKIRLFKSRRPHRLEWGEGITEAEFPMGKWCEYCKDEPNAWFYLIITAADGTYAVTKAYSVKDLL